MIYLIGGTSKAGKSFIAKRIMEEKKIPYFSTDFLLWSLGSDDNTGLFNYYTPDNVVSPIIEPYLEKIVYFLNRNKNDYVIEGTHVTISLYKKLKEKYKDNIKCVFLGYPTQNTNKKYDEVLTNDDNSSNKWYKLLSECKFKEFLESKIKESIELENECLKNNIKFFNVENVRKQQNEIIDYLIGM